MDKFKRDEEAAYRDYLGIIDQINDVYGKIITEDVLCEKSHIEIAELIAKTDMREGTPEAPILYCSENDYCEALIAYYKANILRLMASEIDKSIISRHINIVVISLCFAGLLAFSNSFPLVIIGGALLYGYLAKKEIKKAKERLDSKYMCLDMIEQHKKDIAELEVFIGK